MTPVIRHSLLLALIRFVVCFVVLFLLLIPITAVWALGLDAWRARGARLFCSIACSIFGVRLTVEGSISPERPLMVISNHASYLDILILGALAPVSFTPKLEIRSWPVIGFLCLLADCVFIERRPADIQRAQAEIAAKLSEGKVIALFPEGTTGDGFHVKPFKSGFLSLVEAHDLPLQPVMLAYTHIGDVPLSAQTREHVSWIGDATLVGHIVRLLSFPCVRVTVQCYPVERMANYEDRKAITKACEAIITTGLAKTLEANGVTS